MNENYEHRIKFLWNLSTKLPNSIPYNLLKSYYLTTLRDAAKHQFVLPKDKFGPAAKCEKCSSNWLSGNFSMRSVSQSLKSSKSRKLIESLESDKEKLTRKQKIKAKWLKKKMQSLVELTCSLCNNKTKIQLRKPTKTDPVKVSSQKCVMPLANSKNKNIISTIHKAKITKVCRLETNNNLRHNSSITDTTMKQAKNSKKIPQHHESLKKIGKKKRVDKIGKNMTISKTQQKNNLLQLAELLKKDSEKANGVVETNNRLKKLLN